MTVAIAGGLAVLCVVGPLLPCNSGEWPYVAVATAFACGFAASMSFANGRPSCVARTYAFFLGAAVCVPALSIGMIAAFRQGEPAMLVIVPIATVVGLTWSLPIGAAMTTAFLLPLTVTNRAHAHPTVQGFDRAAARLGLWMAMVALACLLWASVPVGRGFATGAGLAGLSLAGAMAAKIARRRRWLRKVHLGRVPGWTIIDLDTVDDVDVPEDLPAWDLARWSDEPKLICAVHLATHAGPYRQEQRIEPRFTVTARAF